LSNLRACLGAAVRAGLIPTNPVRSAKKPKSVKRKLDPFTAEELASIVSEGGKSPVSYILAFLAATGARAGEAIALGVGDYDATAGTVSIVKGFQGSKHGVGKTKTPGSVRTIAMPPQIIPVLDAAVSGRTSGYLFPSTTVRPKNHSALVRPWLSLLRRLGIRERNPHQLRHAFISCAVAAGLPIADVAKYVGNSPAMIMRVYLHPRNADVAGVMGAVLEGKR
jgi:integrase